MAGAVQLARRELQRIVDGHVDAVVGDLIRAWARGWNEVSADWDRAVAQILAEGRAGDLTAAEVFRLTAVRAALGVSIEALRRLSTDAVTITVGRVPALAAATATGELRMIAAQLPDAFGGPEALSSGYGHALEAIVNRTTQQVTSLARPIADDAYQAMLAELTRGVALGVNPQVVGRRIIQRTRGGFDGGLSRATRIARTEMLDAHRNAAHAVDQTNADVLAGWRWNAKLSRTTCPACLSMSGREFPVEVPGPHGHVNCRCARTPVTKSWAQLGFAGMEDTRPAAPDPEAWFWSQPRAVQLAIMGPTRLRLLEEHAVTWDDLAVEVHNPGWRTSYQPRTLTDLRSMARLAM